MREKLKEDNNIYLLVVKVNLCAACRQHTSSSSRHQIKGDLCGVDPVRAG